MKKFGIISALLLLGCSSVLAQVARPTALWFNKVISVERSRQFYIALNANMWVNYDLPNCVLTQAWQGGTTGGAFLTGAPYAALGGANGQYWFYNAAPQFPHVYRSSGTSYFRDSNQVAEYFASYTNPSHVNTTTYYIAGKWPLRPINTQWGGTYKSWTVRDAANIEVAAKVRYRGFTAPASNVLTLKYGLILANNTEISISENPEYSNLPSGNHLIRTFSFSNIPSGFQVRQEKLGGSNAAAWTVTSGSATITGGVLIQTANGQTILNGSF